MRKPRSSSRYSHPGAGGPSADDRALTTPTAAKALTYARNWANSRSARPPVRAGPPSWSQTPDARPWPSDRPRCARTRSRAASGHPTRRTGDARLPFRYLLYRKALAWSPPVRNLRVAIPGSTGLAMRGARGTPGPTTERALGTIVPSRPIVPALDVPAPREADAASSTPSDRNQFPTSVSDEVLLASVSPCRTPQCERDCTVPRTPAAHGSGNSVPAAWPACPCADRARPIRLAARDVAFERLWASVRGWHA